MLSLESFASTAIFRFLGVIDMALTMCVAHLQGCCLLLLQ